METGEAAEEVRKALEPEATRLFGPGSWNGVWKVLGGYQPPENQSALRVYRAILKLSEGRIDLLRHYTTQASSTSATSSIGPNTLVADNGAEHFRG